MTRRPEPRIWPAVLFSIAIIVLAVLALVSPAKAQGTCDVAASAITTLARNGFTGHSGGPMSNGSHVTVYTHPSGAWMAVVFRSDGLACIAAQGVGWAEVKANA